ncbi:hypothetical protein [Niveispirillum sp.]|uniref:hypothetical protein n=1 Tax=Niveispirillum sp. TaxID=1917217 RepID=UPI001B6C1D08|nr:hypothetical protein [Niveispirillum sp.]MBP7339013.1 hypothetical protein [Niveispirillum sp.]
MSSARTGRIGLWCCAVILMLGTGGCATFPPKADAGKAPAVASLPPPAPRTAATRPAPEPATPAKRPATAKPPPVSVPAPDPAPPPLRPVGMDEETLKNLLGQPSASRDETPARVLSFRRSQCALNLTLYPDVESRVFRTLSYEVTSDDHDERTARTCHARFGLPADDAVGVAARR